MIAALLLACTAANDGTTLPSSTTTTTTTTTETDLDVVKGMVAGRIAFEEATATVAWRGGWPVLDGDTAWFVVAEDGRDWAVAGDFDGWTPEPMDRGPGFRYLQAQVGSAPEGLRYKLTAGADWIADPLARSYEYDGYGEISFVEAPTDHARLDRWPRAEGTGVGPRELRVWVPAGAGPWPTLYMHDGQNLFDPNGIWGGWRMPEALGSRDPVLVVGIDNTIDRFEDYTHVPDDVGYGGPMGGEGDEYAAFVQQVVRPHVEATYGAPDAVGVMGSSLGGLISLVIAQDYPDDYDFAGSLSGTLGWGRFTLDEETIEERFLAVPPTGLVVYADSGGGPGNDGQCRDLDGDGFSEDDPDSSDNYCETRQFVDALSANGWTWDDDLFHWWEPGAQHNEAEWAARVGGPLDLFLSL
ncbi:MAG: prolyl oligopeptidase family serine peptidase [Myxococcales bacterium]|nr:prolyl oligopeptidase family serine peptidase [Myxococcales bacterium]